MMRRALVVVVVWLLAVPPVGGDDSVGLVDPATGTWYLRDASGEVTGFFYGNPGDVPFVGDWDCDGIDTPGLYRQSDGFAYLRNSNTQGVADIRFFFGNPGDFPLAGDFNGDGCDTLSIYRASEATIYVINELGTNDGGLGSAEFSYIFGNPGDKPFVGDFDGDGIDTLGLHRESTGFVYFRQTNTQGIADAEFFYGDPGDRLVAGDWGIVDGVDTPAIFRPSNSTFYFRYTNTQGVAEETLGWGVSSFLPIAGNWGVVTAGGPVPDPGGPGPGGPGGPGTTLPLEVAGTLPNATALVAYSAQIGISGGTPPYTVQKTAGHWANVSTPGLVTGVPTAGDLGLANLQVRVTDAAGTQVLASIPLTVVGQCANLGGTALLECQALAALYNSTNGNGWTERTGWFTSANFCTWFGIVCTAGDAGNVAVISVDANALNGSIASVPFGNLAQLRVFDINGNAVGGQIPESLVNRPLLETLDVGENDFTNDIPTALWSRPQLIDLDLSENGFTGPMTDVTGLNSILTIDMSDNAFDGELPASLWTRTTLTSLDLANNLFSGALAPEIGGLTALTALDLSDNEFGGPGDDVVPDLIRTGLMDTLTSLSLHGNNCFTPEGGVGGALDLFLSSFDLNWNDAGVCPPP